jgi:hypothetical protein
MEILAQVHGYQHARKLEVSPGTRRIGVLMGSLHEDPSYFKIKSMDIISSSQFMPLQSD